MNVVAADSDSGHQRVVLMCQSDPREDLNSGEMRNAQYERTGKKTSKSVDNESERNGVSEDSFGAKTRDKIPPDQICFRGVVAVRSRRGWKTREPVDMAR